MSESGEILLDAADTRSRLLQQALVLAGAVALVSGLVALGVTRGATRWSSAFAVVAGVALVFASTRVLVRWDVPYHGHVIRFENHIVFGECLVIDKDRVTQGALGYRKVLEGTIKRGTRAGTRVRAESEAGLFRFRCRITVS